MWQLEAKMGEGGGGGAFNYTCKPQLYSQVVEFQKSIPLKNTECALPV